VDATNLDKFEKALKENTKMVWLESPTNPLLKVIDIRATADIVHEKIPQARLVIDNTFLSAYYQKPLTIGADMVMYSLTKYMGVVMGSVATNDDEFYEKLRFYQKGLESSLVHSIVS
jgi:cystathionine gamma-lyase